MSQEIFGEWVHEVDRNWRLVIPAPIRRTIGQDQVILLKLNAENCIEIEKASFEVKEIDSSATTRRIKNGRITIPPWLRNSTSFYFGKKVMLTLQNGHCEVWPWR